MRSWTRRALLATGVVLAAGSGSLAQAQQAVKVGLILPMTGPQASTGREIEAAAKLYVAQHGATVAGKTIELVVRDDTGNADITKRLAQELVVNDKVSVIAGMGLTPLALAVGPVATQAKVPAVIMAAATASILDTSPWYVRTSQTVPQIAAQMGEWAAQNGIKKAVSLVTDYGPGYDSETWFKNGLVGKGGEVLAQLRVPLANPDFAPFLQKAKDLKPDALFIFVPSGSGAALMKQVKDRGLIEAGIKIIGTGDVTDDEQLNGMGDDVLGLITAQHYSAAHDSPENKAFVADFAKANPSMRPNFMAVGGYDGMALIYKALEKTAGDTNGQKMLDAMKGMAWTSPRGPISVDATTRDIVQNVYIRKVERQNGQLYNVEMATIPNVKDPSRTGK